MRIVRTALAVAAILAPAPAVSAAVVGGAHYAPQYSYEEFFAATDGKQFPVIVVGVPFEGVQGAESLARLLPILQAAKPRPALTFTYDRPAERARPDYRLVLVFDPAASVGADAVCRGEAKVSAGRSEATKVYAVYCRNEMAMSEATARADGRSDAELQRMFTELLQVVFSPIQRPENDRRIRP